MSAADDLIPAGGPGEELKKKIKAQAAQQLQSNQDRINQGVGMASGNFFQRKVGGG